MISSFSCLEEYSFSISDEWIKQSLHVYTDPLRLLTKYCNDYWSYEYECKFFGVNIDSEVEEGFHKGVNLLLKRTERFIRSKKSNVYDRALYELMFDCNIRNKEFFKIVWGLYDENSCTTNEKFGNLFGEFTVQKIPLFDREFGQINSRFVGFRTNEELYLFYSEVVEAYQKMPHNCIEHKPVGQETRVTLNDENVQSKLRIIRNFDKFSAELLLFFNQEHLDKSIKFSRDEMNEFAICLDAGQGALSDDLRKKMLSVLSETDKKYYYGYFLNFIAKDSIRNNMLGEFRERQSHLLGDGFGAEHFKKFVKGDMESIPITPSNDDIMNMISSRKSLKDLQFGKTIDAFNSKLFKMIRSQNQ